MENVNRVYAQAIVDGRTVDLLLEEEDLVRGFKNALSHPDEIPALGQCWSCDKPNKCGLLDRILKKCCDCK